MNKVNDDFERARNVERSQLLNKNRSPKERKYPLVLPYNKTSKY